MDKIYKNNIKKYLEEAKANGKTITNIIKDAQVGVGTFYEIMRGNQVPRLDTAVKISRALNATTFEIFPILKEEM
ncbi:hypothetical protein DP145_01545 [Clostridium tetani]|uniref:hypothetical protein n=1 Tax=Clostridium tetani TaxID=1513 RepID=UPI00100BA412|nr:hypothetical protein [Clostridium tetani]RXI46051.1 hypothetical protein DP126_07625 [Clostridium tetani]RXM61443.1 hypothetical protein DP138_04460 [Clostridium tetani]RXM70268.1 hypothetical protein DP145_01545 [Clostridium tetani]